MLEYMAIKPPIFENWMIDDLNFEEWKNWTSVILEDEIGVFARKGRLKP